jgi:hypothetical protein
MSCSRQASEANYDHSMSSVSIGLAELSTFIATLLVLVHISVGNRISDVLYYAVRTNILEAYLTA